MKLLIPLCPTCEKRASSISESLLCNASIRVKKDGTFDYTGDNDLAWDTQEPVVDEDGLVEVQCINGHYWTTSYQGI
jgi:hypothetical protein